METDGNYLRHVKNPMEEAQMDHRREKLDSLKHSRNDFPASHISISIMLIQLF